MGTSFFESLPAIGTYEEIENKHCP